MNDSATPVPAGKPATYPGEKAVAIVYLVSAVAFLGFFIARFITRLEVFWILTALSAAVLIVTRWRLRIYEAQRDPAKAARLTLRSQMMKLAIAAPLIIAFILAIRVGRALVRDESVGAAFGEGALLSVAVLAALVVLALLGRLASRVLFKV
jgi:hypothetical protein